MKKDVVFIAIFIIVVLLVCAAFAFILVKIVNKNVNEAGVQNKKNSTREVKTLDISPVEEICKDTDNILSIPDGKNITNPGKTCIGKDCSSDKCVSQEIVQEYYCMGNKIVSANISCPTGLFCQKGKDLAYCVKIIKNVSLKSDRTKASYLIDGAKYILFYASVNSESESSAPFSVFLSMNSQSSGKYKTYDDREMILNKAANRYEVKVQVKNIETYQEPTILTSAAVVKMNNAIVAESPPWYVNISWR